MLPKTVSYLYLDNRICEVIEPDPTLSAAVTVVTKPSDINRRYSTSLLCNLREGVCARYAFMV